ncbi:winged helix-turn-helix domain-containing protein [Bradyrhizobium sp. STM 3809]|uniref:ArsR/SmtB family transcription factor n=1 Tax=Bradyrhizobium sp. STM 3809 TaxID=551936 RepID=UPI000240A3C6|nr:winged helix-turn-helix domain-containing protein [Bradyrhizobium sp. STM 3809]CCE03959.1 Transcriptional Regulator, ArsR family protein [Bradyrhizobium sp. STM 3809]
MKDGPNFAAIAALIGDPARANILSALMDGRALTVSELARSASIGLPTASAHVTKLERAALLVSVRQGRHRYVRLSGEDVVHTLETLMLLAARTGHSRVRTGPRDPALRTARVCYDHLAGARGVQLYESLLRRQLLQRSGDHVTLTSAGRTFTERFGIDLDQLQAKDRVACVSCLDWSERRDHLAGRLGSAYLTRLFALKWARRDKDSRAVLFSQSGLREFERLFPL